MKIKMKRMLASYALFALSFGALGVDRDNVTCGIINGKALANAVGPYDYTNKALQKDWQIVLDYHFTKDVASLKKGATGSIYGDIDYTLRAIPNFHPGLFALNKLAQRNKRKLDHRVTQSFPYYTPECYFRRAEYFSPKDYITKMLFAMYYHQSDALSKAKQKYLEALALSPRHPEINYNIGLLFVDMGDWRRAQKHADVAYSQNYPLSGLKRKLSAATQ